jgi:hypothetical protein
MTPLPTLLDPLESLLERILASHAAARGVPDSWRDRLLPIRRPDRGAHLQRPGAIFVGTYDCEVSEAMLLEDLRAAGAGAE